MTRSTTTRVALAAWALLMLALTPFGAGATTPATSAPHRKSAAPAKHASRPRAKRSVPTPAPKPAGGATTDAMPRTLDDVHIEGEIPVPQVLFITAREQRRFMDFQHHRYTRNSTQLGEATPFPTWVAVTHDPPIDPKKETSR